MGFDSAVPPPMGRSVERHPRENTGRPTEESKMLLTWFQHSKKQYVSISSMNRFLTNARLGGTKVWMM